MVEKEIEKDLNYPLTNGEGEPSYVYGAINKDMRSWNELNFCRRLRKHRQDIQKEEKSLTIAESATPELFQNESFYGYKITISKHRI